MMFTLPTQKKKLVYKSDSSHVNFQISVPPLNIFVYIHTHKHVYGIYIHGALQAVYKQADQTE